MVLIMTILALFLGAIAAGFGYMIGFGHGEVAYALKLKKKKADEEAIAKKAEEEKLQHWNAETQFLSVPKAVAHANQVARELLINVKDHEKFAVFCRQELEQHLRQAELTWAMFDCTERNSWMRNPHIVSKLDQALREEGFSAEFYIPEDGQHEGRMFIKVIGRN